MNGCLPTLEQLNELPLRALVAYAYRAARRTITKFKVEDVESIRDLLRCAEEFVCVPTVPLDALRHIALAAASVVGTEQLHSGARIPVILPVLAVADCCICAFDALHSELTDAERHRARAVRKAVKATAEICELEFHRVVADYETLARVFGLKTSVELGDVFDLSEDGPLGPLTVN